MSNPFDQLGYSDMSGFFGKVKKAWGKAKKNVEKVRNKIEKVTGTHKIHKKIRKVGTKIGRNDAVRMAAAIAAAYFVGPAAIAALKTAAASGVSAFTSTAAKFGLKFTGSTLLKHGAKTVATTAIKQQLAKKQIKAANRHTEKLTKLQLNQDAKMIEQLGTSPEFLKIYETLKAKGYDDRAIMNYWGSSAQFRNAAVPEITQTILPTLQAAYQNEGWSQKAAYDAALVDADNIAEEEVKKAGGIDAKTILMVAVPAITALLMNK